MRQLDVSIEDKARMLDIIIDEFIKEYNDGPAMDKKYHSKAEKLGYEILVALNDNGFITAKGIQGQ